MRDIILRNSRAFASDMLMQKAISEVEQLILTVRELESRYETTSLILEPAWSAAKASLNLLRYAFLGFQYAAMTEQLSSTRTSPDDTTRTDEQHRDDVWTPAKRTPVLTGRGSINLNPASSMTPSANSQTSLRKVTPPPYRPSLKEDSNPEDAPKRKEFVHVEIEKKQSRSRLKRMNLMCNDCQPDGFCSKHEQYNV